MSPPAGHTLRTAFLLLGLWALASLLVGLPGHPERMFGPAHLGLSAELGAAILAAALIGRAGREAGRGVRLALAVALLLILLRLADLAANRAAGRPFDPSFDFALMPALWEVMTASAHPALLAAGLAAALAALAAGCWWLVGGLVRIAARPEAARSLALLLVPLLLAQAGAVLAGAGWRPLQPMERGGLSFLNEHAVRYARAVELRASSRAALAVDPVAAMPMDRRLAALAGRDVIVVWIESYGHAALTDPRHAPTLLARLDAAAKALEDAGFHTLSGLVEAPVLGGRSWLAHGTFRSGISMPEPPVQGLVLASGRRSLVHAFAEGGWETVAVGPALSRPWPEGMLWGFDRVVQQGDLGYAGPAFGWSPMPDQFVLDRVEALDLRGTGRPVYLEVALTTSHAPWTPLPPFLEEGTSADGAEFHAVLEAPDYADMAGGYARSLDYALRATVDWLVRAVTDDALVILIGDHPALPWIAGGTDDRTVPWHILSRDAGVLDLMAGWGLTPGLRPDGAGPVLPMRDILPLMLDTFSPEPAPAS